MVDFKGVCRYASVWFNGCFLGGHYSGYTGFSFDITDMARYGDEGDNVLLVRVDTTTGPEGWWYEGAGIYRSVSVCGILQTRVFSRDGTCVAKQAAQFKTTPYSQTVLQQETEAASPILWDLGNPYLYQGITTVEIGEVTIDTYCTTFGIREVAYTTEGFFLNGTHIDLKGTCNHQDFAGVGVALPDGIQEYRIKKLLEMGSNAYRSAHHPADPVLLNACDQMGMLVMNENRIMESSQLRIGELESMIRRDRNHPSIVFWFLCNEELMGGSAAAARILRHLAAVVRSLDTTRPIVSAELIDPEAGVNPEYAHIFDVVGINYPESPILKNGMARAKRQSPMLKFLNTEAVSYFSTRGVYEDDWGKCHTSNFGSHFSMFMSDRGNPNPQGEGGTSYPEKAFAFYRENRYSGGVFVWTGFDYRGEPSPFSWPAVGSQFGIMNSCGFPKDYFYYYQSKWTRIPVLHIMPHWTWPGDEGKMKLVRIFTNCNEVELFLCGKSVGRKACKDSCVEFHIPYHSGELRAIGRNGGGEETAKKILQTAGASTSLKLRLTEGKLRCGKADVLVVWAEDADGIFTPTAEDDVRFTCSGNGKILGVGNGNPANHDSELSSCVRLFGGLAAVVVQAGAQPRQMTVVAQSRKLGKAVVNVECTDRAVLLFEQ